ncbi:hypothetical protein QYZ46_26550 [Vibrio parahaemolyticus]|nr:hypothetical protein [Vibrio parahaemolyticus]
MSFLILGKTLEQWTFSSDEQVAFLDQWLKADRYKLTTKEFCQSLVENGTDALKQIGQAGLDAPGQGQRFVDVLEGWFPSVVLSSIRAAESAGQRHIGLQTAIEQLKGGENIVAKLVKMLAFPYALTVGAGFYGVYIADKMLSAIDNKPGIGLTVRNFLPTMALPSPRSLPYCSWYWPWHCPIGKAVVAQSATIGLCSRCIALPWHPRYSKRWRT